MRPIDVGAETCQFCKKDRLSYPGELLSHFTYTCILDVRKSSHEPCFVRHEEVCKLAKEGYKDVVGKL